MLSTFCLLVGSMSEKKMLPVAKVDLAMKQKSNDPT